MEAAERYYPVRFSLHSRILAGRVGFTLLCLIIWQLFSLVFGDFWFSTPVSIVLRLAELAASGELFIHTLVTLREAAIGFAIGASLGIGLPFLLRLTPGFANVIDPYLAAAMGVPKLALAPLLILWFGIDLTSKIVFVTIIVFFLFFFNAWAGIRSVNPDLIKVARVMGANQKFLTREIVWHTALPYIFAGCKIALPRAVSAAVVAEFIAAEQGLGFYINDARGLFDTTGIFAGVVVVTIIIMVLNAGLNRLHARSMHWQPEEHDVAML